MFIHEKKFYRQIIDGATGLAFTLKLANIFMWKRGKEFVRLQIGANEIYGTQVSFIDEGISL